MPSMLRIPQNNTMCVTCSKFGLEFSALIVNRRSGVFQFPLPKGARMCMCNPLRMLHRTPSKIGFIEGLAGIGKD